MRTPYQRGVGAEYRCLETLKAQGYAVIRAASSHGVFDLAGVRSDSAIFIQVKQGAGKPTLCDYRALVDLQPPPGAICAVVWYPPGRECPRVLYSSEPLPFLRFTNWQAGEAPKQAAMRFPQVKVASPKTLSQGKSDQCNTTV